MVRVGLCKWGQGGFGGVAAGGGQGGFGGVVVRVGLVGWL